MQLRNVKDVSDWGLCIGCGACAYICPENITLVNVISEGIRPRFNHPDCGTCDDCLKACSGINVEHRPNNDWKNSNDELKMSWGPILEIWEGYAADPEIRHNGSSGGLASALALYCIEKEKMYGLLHIGKDEISPLSNKTFFSTSKSEILARTGSRYAPASPCDSLSKFAKTPGPSAFIGKPCDVAALTMAQAIRSEIAEKVGVKIGFFCAGTPSTQGTLDLIKSLGLNSDNVEDIRYRGKGWPGKLSVKIKGEEQTRDVMSYSDSWGFLQKYRPYRCHLCPDGTGEFADISCGDPWYRKIGDKEVGQSLVLVRTERGRVIVKGAIESGYVKLTEASSTNLEDSQRNLLFKRRAIWGRILAMKIFGIPTPNFQGFSLFENWKQLSLKEKAKSILGTARRIVQRRYYRPNR